nr:uncharacterized protein LOC128675934 isoform X2 [Plodia interpunctella]
MQRVANLQAVQERAMVLYHDPDYVKDPQAFTGRLKRGYPYRTNFTATTLHPWANNVTFSLVLSHKRTGNDPIMAVRVCDALSHSWMAEFIWTYFHTKTCPYPPRTYSAVNLELPPKNYPFPVPKGDIQIFAYFSLTESKHILVKYSLKIHV